MSGQQGDTSMAGNSETDCPDAATPRSNGAGELSDVAAFSDSEAAPAPASSAGRYLQRR